MQGIFEDGVEKIVTPRGNIAVVDNLVSTSGLDALSDKQGNILAKDIASYVLSGDKPESTLTTGTFFVDKTGALRVAKSDISTSTDVSDSNSEVKSVGEVLKTLNASLAGKSELFRAQVSVTFTNGKAYDPNLFGVSDRDLAFVVGINLAASTDTVTSFSVVNGSDGVFIRLFDEAGAPVTDTGERTVCVIFTKRPPFDSKVPSTLDYYRI